MFSAPSPKQASKQESKRLLLCLKFHMLLAIRIKCGALCSRTCLIWHLLVRILYNIVCQGVHGNCACQKHLPIILNANCIARQQLANSLEAAMCPKLFCQSVSNDGLSGSRKPLKRFTPEF
eukprot:4658594-Amphidinium_carterae.1